VPKLIGSLSTVKRRLGERIKQARGANTSAVVGYIQTYSVIVHEDLDASHAPGKTAKYLEIPLRQNMRVLADMISKHYLRTLDLGQALLVGCNFLKRLSQQIVPVDTGALRASAFTAMADDEDGAATAAFYRSESIRLAAKGK
jgi:hypothetical protein